MIEAHLLFGLSYSKIDVVVHPQSVIHSMVTFIDGSTIAQASPPDMRLPIALGLSLAGQAAGRPTACDFLTPSAWTFEPVDSGHVPGAGLARAAGIAGGLVPAAFNAANEQAVAAFTSGALTFPGIFEVLDRIVDEADHLRAEPSRCAGRPGRRGLGAHPGGRDDRTHGGSDDADGHRPCCTSSGF